MSAVTEGYAESFFNALSSRDPSRIARFVAEDADWLIVGPIELFPYCGQHVGKAAVLAAYGQMADRFTTASYARDFLMTNGESAAALTRLTDVQRTDGRQVVIRLAQFARFKDGKVIEYCSMADTLAVAEQAVGHALISAADAPALADS